MAGEEKQNAAQKGASVAGKFVNKLKGIVRFFRTGIGIILLKIILVVLVLLFIYILGRVIFGRILELLGFNSGIGGSEYNRSSEFIQSLSSSGYDSMVSANQLTRYYAFEYSVLMDAAEYLEETGVTAVRKFDSGTIDWDAIKGRRDIWAYLAAAAFQKDGADSDYSRYVTVPKPQNNSSGGSGDPYPAPSGEFYYRIMKNEYTNETVLMPYFRIVRNDYDLRYYFEFDDMDGTHSGKGVPFVKGDQASQLALAQMGKLYEMSGAYLYPGLTGLKATGKKYRFEGPNQPGGADLAQAAAFIEKYVFPVKFCEALNTGNAAAFVADDVRGAGAEPINLDDPFDETSLYYSQQNQTVNYEVPLRSILDRFLPNASLMSSWRFLTNEKDEQGNVAEDLVNNIFTIYTAASLEGEDVEAGLWLLKDVFVVSDVTNSTEAKTILKNVQGEGKEPIDYYYGNEAYPIGEKKYNSYYATADSRGLPGYESLVDPNTPPEPTQTFSNGTNIKADIINDVKLVFAHHAERKGITYSSSDMSSIESAVTSAISAIDSPASGDMDPINDVEINLYDSYIFCQGYTSGDNRISSRLVEHYEITDPDKVTVVVNDTPVRHIEVREDGNLKTHIHGTTCSTPFIRISYQMEKGLKKTAVIIRDGEKAYGYLVSAKEAKSYDRYTNKKAFAHLESGDLKSTTIREWNFSTEGEESNETWFVTDAYEGLTYDVEPGNPSITVKFYPKGSDSYQTRHPSVSNPEEYKQAVRDALPSGEFVFGHLTGLPVSSSDILPKHSFAVVRSGDTYSSDTTVGPRNYPADKVAPVVNAFLSAQGMADAGVSVFPSTVEEPGECSYTDKDILDLKKLRITTQTEFPLNISSTRSAIQSIIDSKVEYKGNAWEVAKRAIINAGYGSELLEATGKSSYDAIDGPAMSAIDLRWHPSLDNTNLRWDSRNFFSVGSITLTASTQVTMPVRVSVQPISQRIIDKEMPAYFVKYANYWAAEKDIDNIVQVKGEFKSHEEFVYLISNNPSAVGVEQINSSYKNITWRCDLFAPIFGAADRNKQDSGREGDVKLILTEWQTIGESGVGAADHYIRDLYSLIQYSKGVKDETTGEWISGFEPIKKANGESYIHEDSYCYLYIPDEIISFDELTTEAAFWLDRIICTLDKADKIYDRAITRFNQGASENKFRSRLVTFTWQVVDYDLYNETVVPNTNGAHAVYALWPFGDMSSRLLYALAANASEKELDKVSGWGGTYSSHPAADLYGRTMTERIYKSAFTSKTVVTSPYKTMFNSFYGYGYYKLSYGEGSLIKAKYFPSINDVILYKKGDTITEDGDDIIVNGIRITGNIDYFRSGNETENEDLTFEDYEVVGGEDISSGMEVTPGTGLYFKNTPVTLKLGRGTYSFNGTAAASYAYLLYRQALITRDGDKAEKELKEKLEKEMQWTEVRAIAPGIVTDLGGNGGSGFWVKIVHVREVGDDNQVNEIITSSYCHMKRYPMVQVGQYVGAGTVLGYEGTTGKSKGYHVHNNLKVNGNPAKPVMYYYPFFTPFWYEEKSEEALTKFAEENSGSGFLGNDYFSIPRTIYPYGEKITSAVETLMNARSGRATHHLSDGAGGTYFPGDLEKINADNDELKSAAAGDYPFNTGDRIVNIQNYTPTYSLIDDYERLIKPFDADDMTKVETSPNVHRDGDVPDYDGPALNSNPDFIDEDFQKDVMHNMGRIHGHYPGVMQYYSFTSGAADKEEIWNMLMEEIGNPWAVAGVMGNIQAESSFNPTSCNFSTRLYANNPQDYTGEQYAALINKGANLQPGTGMVQNEKGEWMVTAFGLVQLTKDRQQNLINWARMWGVPVEDAGMQISFVIKELNERRISGFKSDTYGYDYSFVLGPNGRYDGSQMDMLQDEETLRKIGEECYNKNKALFDDPNKNPTVIANLSPQEQANAFKAIGASEMMLHKYEIAEGQSGYWQHDRAQLSLNFLCEYGFLTVNKDPVTP